MCRRPIRAAVGPLAAPVRSRFAYAVPSPRPQVAASAFRRRRGPEGRHATLQECARQRAHRPGLRVRGPRGVGKTTTARILARALNCVTGTTAEPCGVCEPCVEIARAATWTSSRSTRPPHAGGEGPRGHHRGALDPARPRPLQDLHHRRGAPALGHSFNALLKSIEEPPPRVAFMMATTALDKIPETIISRAHVFEFRMISAKAIAAQLRKIAMPRASRSATRRSRSSRARPTAACATPRPPSTR